MKGLSFFFLLTKFEVGDTSQKIWIHDEKTEVEKKKKKDYLFLVVYCYHGYPQINPALLAVIGRKRSKNGAKANLVAYLNKTRAYQVVATVPISLTTVKHKFDKEV